VKLLVKFQQATRKTAKLSSLIDYEPVASWYSHLAACEPAVIYQPTRNQLLLLLPLLLLSCHLIAHIIAVILHPSRVLFSSAIYHSFIHFCRALCFISWLRDTQYPSHAFNAIPIYLSSTVRHSELMRR